MATAVQRATFLNMIIPIAIEQAKKHNMKIYPSVCIAQAIHESGWGTSTKMVRANALFGVKVGKSAYKFGTAWKGKAYKTGTTEYYDGKNPTKIVDFFRAYDSVADATEDYYDMLCHCQRYKGALNQPTPQKCIEGIIAGGYATGPEYVKAIKLLLADKTYNLTQYDKADAQIRKMNPYTLTSSLMKEGVKGSSVKWLQWELNESGANLKVDGVFGKQTKLAVLLYQKDHGLVQDGIVGKKTIESLKS